MDAKKKTIPPCDYYCDTLYLLPYSTFVNLPSGYSLISVLFFVNDQLDCFSLLCINSESRETASETSSTISSEVDVKGRSEHNSMLEEVSCVEEHKKQEVKLLDLYSGCGAMSTGFCIGGILSGVNLVTVSHLVDQNSHNIYLVILLSIFLILT